MAPAPETAGVSPTPPAQTGALLGLAQDTRPDSDFNLFAHERYLRLNLARKRFRLQADWSAALPGDESELQRVSALIDGAFAGGAEVMVTIKKRAGVANPSPAEYADGVSALHARFGGKVSYWGVYNEPSIAIGRDPSSQQAELLAAYFDALEDVVGASRVIGPEFTDNFVGDGDNAYLSSDGLSSEVSNWVARYRSAGGGFGAGAGMHPYGAVTRRTTSSIDQYRSLLPPGTPIWLTEIGALMGRQKQPVTVDGDVVDAADQNAQVEYLLDVIGESPGLERIYYYALTDPNPQANWDTGLLELGDGAARPSWTTFCERALGSC